MIFFDKSLTEIELLSWQGIKSLAKFSRPDFSKLKTYFHTRDFPPNKTIYQQDQAAVAIFYVLQGSIGLFRSDSNHQVERVKVALQGESFGFAGVLVNTNHQETAITLEDVRVLTLMQSEFIRLTRQYPSLAIHLLCGLLQESMTNWYSALNEYQALTMELTKSNIII